MSVLTRSPWLAALSTSLALSALSVDSATAQSPRPGPKARPVARPRPTGVVPPGLTNVANRILETVRAADPSYLQSLFDRKAFMERVVTQVTDDPGAQKAFTEGALTTFHPMTHLINQPNAIFHFKGVYQRDGKTALRYRTLADGGVTFTEFAVTRDGSQWAIVDIFSGTVGDWTSQVMVRSLLLFAPKSTMERINQAFGLSPKSNTQELVLKMRRFITAARTQQFDASAKAYAVLPASLKKQKWVQTTRLASLTGVSPEDSKYQETMIDVARGFAKDPTMSLLVLDGLIFLKKYRAALTAVDVAQRNYGPDAYLDYLTGNVHILKGDQKSAVTAYETAIKREPALDYPYYDLVAVHVAAKQFKPAAQVVKAFHAQFAQPFPDLTTAVENYGEFTASKYYPKFRAAP